MSATLSGKVRSQIEKTVAEYAARYDSFLHFARRVRDEFLDNAEFMQLVHSIRVRAKEVTHLADKLTRKAVDATTSRQKFDITPDNLFQRVCDLAGVRILHIHTQQLCQIHPKLLEVLKHYKHTVVDQIAYTWDTENTTLFQRLGIRTEDKPSLYTSLHIIIRPFHDDIRCEIQVRTLAEELWGEVSHKIDYPHATESVACTEQLLALARSTSACTRLVDSLFASREEHRQFVEKITALQKKH